MKLLEKIQANRNAGVDWLSFNEIELEMGWKQAELIDW